MELQRSALGAGPCIHVSRPNPHGNSDGLPWKSGFSSVEPQPASPEVGFFGSNPFLAARTGLRGPFPTSRPRPMD